MGRDWPMDEVKQASLPSRSTPTRSYEGTSGNGTKGTARPSPAQLEATTMRPTIDKKSSVERPDSLCYRKPGRRLVSRDANQEGYSRPESLSPQLKLGHLTQGSDQNKPTKIIYAEAWGQGCLATSKAPAAATAQTVRFFFFFFVG